MPASAPKSPTRRSRAAAAALWLAAASFTIAFLLLAAGRAEGGTYRAVQCSKSHEVGRGDFTFERSSQHYQSLADCEGRGLLVRHRARSTNRDRWGAWTLEAPAGAMFTALRAKVAGTSAAGHEPEVLMGPPDAMDASPAGRSHGTPHVLRWSDASEGAAALTSRLRCSASGGCGEGIAARALIRNVSVRLADEAHPAAELAGEIADLRTQRGSRELVALVSDRGAGVRRVFLEVNSKPLGKRRLGCALRERVALRLRPCPAEAERSWLLDTDGRGFRQGPNWIRVCTDDWASAGPANRTCERTQVRVDNECPIDEGSERGVIDAAIAGAESGKPVRRDEPVHVEGTLTDTGGAPIAGAEVCVATRTHPAGGRPERVVATPTTDSRGAFRVRLRPGPSREVRVAHWPDSERASERYLNLRVRARPRLRVSPDRTLRNGEEARFEVRLHGPDPARREVRLEVRSDGRWQVIRSHRSDERGRWRDSYRFTSTTANRTYRFRAVVPRQQGYPYARGASRVRKVRVSG